MKSPYKSPIVSSDIYQVTLTVIHKGLFILSKQMHNVDINNLTQVHSRLHCWSVSSLMTCCCSQTMQQSVATSHQQRQVSMGLW